MSGRSGRLDDGKKAQEHPVTFRSRSDCRYKPECQWKPSEPIKRDLLATFLHCATILLLLLILLLLSVGRAHGQTTGSARVGPGVEADPCQQQPKTYTPISLTANTKLLTGVAAKKYYVCHLHLIAAAATNVALVEGTGSTCGTNTAGMMGGATAATGWNFAANGGIVLGVGNSSVGATATAADDVCLLVSAANQISGILVTVNF